MYTIHKIPGSQYLAYVDPGNFLLVLYFFFLFTGSHFDDATSQEYDHWAFCAVFRLHYRYRYRYRLFRFFGSVTTINYCRYRYRRYSGPIVPKRFWFRYPTLVITQSSSRQVLHPARLYFVISYIIFYIRASNKIAHARRFRKTMLQKKKKNPPAKNWSATIENACGEKCCAPKTGVALPRGGCFEQTAILTIVLSPRNSAAAN